MIKVGFFFLIIWDEEYEFFVYNLGRRECVCVYKLFVLVTLKNFFDF